VVLAEGRRADPGRVAALRVYPPGRPAARHAGLVFLRRLEDGQSRPPSRMPGRPPWFALCRAATLRWPDRAVLPGRKSQVGMDTMKQRSGPAWHRHMLYVCLALHFLLRLWHQFNPPLALTLPQARLLVAAVVPGKALTPTHALELVQYYTEAESHCVSLAPEEAAGVAS